MNIKLKIDPLKVDLEKLAHAVELLKSLDVLTEDNYIICTPELEPQVQTILESIIENNENEKS